MEKTFKVVLSLWMPVNDTIDFQISELQSQIEEAIIVYNAKYNGMKKIVLENVTKSTIVLLLKAVLPTEQSDINVSRAITFFSRHLYNKCGWNKYSKIESRLFTVVESSETTYSTDNTNSDSTSAPSSHSNNEVVNAFIEYICEKVAQRIVEKLSTKSNIGGTL